VICEYYTSSKISDSKHLTVADKVDVVTFAWILCDSRSLCCLRLASSLLHTLTQTFL